MWTFVRVILNLPYTILALIAGLVSLPVKVTINRKPFAIVIYVRSFWWKMQKNVRGTTAGNIVLLGTKVESGDKKHELIHVEQAMREPLIHPFLYYYQTYKYGYLKNKYEVEAYRDGGNPFIMPDGTKKYFS